MANYSRGLKDVKSSRLNSLVTDEVIVREAVARDADAIAEVHVRTWQSAYRGLVADQILDSLSISERISAWRAWLAGETVVTETGYEDSASLGLVLVAEQNGRVVGFANAGPSRDEDSDDSIGELRAMYLLPDFWGAGIGGELMMQTNDWLRTGYPGATLWVLEGNTRARGFYERYGWRPDGREAKLDRLDDLMEVRYRIEF